MYRKGGNVDSIRLVTPINGVYRVENRRMYDGHVARCDRRRSAPHPNGIQDMVVPLHHHVGGK
jgi:hypothetical protein